MTHLTTEQLLELREPGAEPGLAAAREHLGACPACQAELRQVDQRVARLRALPALRPARDHWPVVRERAVATRRLRRLRWAGIATLATAAALAAVVVSRRQATAEVTTAVAINDVMTRSHQLERVLEAYNPDARVTDGVTARVAGELEDRIAVVDRRLEVAQMLDVQQRDAALLHLWQERVGLLDALVDVHLTRASDVGF
ncbi:MAG: hypothetical protein IPI38_07445 [Gemmatimonadetes bacterium]|jgi:hypothetical protein|nr:hypothetical protein [Gemmatimonadota bacterium]MBK6780522.1 hypothetical protein [Gemmatimonadota bacterium]MBK7351265.1 hypothetical protein [Gemmatimonadota bacterium]MBK7715242.1 hypothetical protein [Gemmatimonadota bacterium]MBK7786425.1 hypothetical protein [Gemmatimonadota bacterium]